MASGRTPLMAGNWKMNLDHLQATHLVQKLDWTLKDGKHDYSAVEVAVLPPFTDIRSVQTLIDGDRLELKHGAQDLSVHDSGAYTGDVSGAFLAKLGCSYVVVGHSERREYHAEGDDVVNAKVKAAYRHGITPIFCCGEGLDIRQAGTHVEHVLAQVEAGLDGLPVGPGPQPRRRLRADLGHRHRRGRDARGRPGGVRGHPHKLAELYSGDVADGIRVLYGGSVKSGNVAAIMAKEDVDGALVGGASIDPVEFAAICRFRDHLTTS